MTLKTPIFERLSRRTVRMPNGCLEWQGARIPAGHGRIGHGNGPGHVYTHRVAWEAAYGPIPDGLLVCHKCDNPPCVEPTHLFLGTNADNMADMARKGRANPLTGEAHPQARFTDGDIQEMRDLRAAGWLQREIAEKFGTRQGVICNILTGRSRSSA